VNWTVYTKPDCVVCDKAKKILDSLGIPYIVKQVGGLGADFEAIGEFSWLDGNPDSVPLVVAHTGPVDDLANVKARWIGKDVANPDSPWTVQVRAFLALQEKP
jgi:glutaredoxin